VAALRLVKQQFVETNAHSMQKGNKHISLFPYSSKLYQTQVPNALHYLLKQHQEQ
jgi:hypothetical protein